MSTGREKDQKDFDLEQIVRVIDQALESDDQRIKDALRALMTITVLCTAEHPDQAIKGPLSRLFEDMHNLNRRLGRVEDELNQVKYNMPKAAPFTPPYNPGSPFTPGTYPSTGWPGSSYPNDPTRPTPMWGSSYPNTSMDSTAKSYKSVGVNLANLDKLFKED